MDDATRLVELLTEFPGLTQRALVVLHDISPSLIYRCVEQGLITPQEQVMGHRSGCHHVFKFYINNK
jgi:hypothetical protein